MAEGLSRRALGPEFGSVADTGELPDDSLVAAAVDGDRAAFAMLVSRHYGRIYRQAYGWLGEQAAAEDVTQDIVVKLARVIHSFSGEARFTTWLHRLVLNHLHDVERARKRKRLEPGLVFEDLQIAAAEVPADRQLAARRALAAINALPEKLRETIMLVHWEGLTHEAAAEVLGCKGGTVSWRVNEARKQLAASLGWQPGDEEIG